MKRLQGFIAGILATLMLTGVFAVAKNMYEKIDVLYNDVKIEIDGEEFIAKDVNGNVVEPFIYKVDIVPGSKLFRHFQINK